jgi:hypothetical protein
VSVADEVALVEVACRIADEVSPAVVTIVTVVAPRSRPAVFSIPPPPPPVAVTATTTASTAAPESHAGEKGLEEATRAWRWRRDPSTSSVVEGL